MRFGLGSGFDVEAPVSSSGGMEGSVGPIVAESVTAVMVPASIPSSSTIKAILNDEALGYRLRVLSEVLGIPVSSVARSRLAALPVVEGGERSLASVYESAVAEYERDMAEYSRRVGEAEAELARVKAAKPVSPGENEKVITDEFLTHVLLVAVNS